MSKRICLGWVALACLLALPSAARAQSAIAGTVKDSSGAVMPGVTVEAASDALIEKSKVAVSDGSGLYKIIDLRPGAYVITFTLSGFQTFKREGLELSSDFTATVDATMKIGSLEESVTVSGASPVVDVQSNVKSQVLAREILDAVPNAHTIQSIGQLIPGVSLSAPDVGGSVQMQQTYFAVHGSGSTATSFSMDGMIINGLKNDGAIQNYLNDATAQEMVYRTGGGGGDQQSGGLLINVVPKEGGNRFSGTASIGVENWQSDNFAQELKDVGVTSTDKLGKYYDISVTQGGPIKKDRLWLFLAGRASKELKPVANSTNSAAFGPQPVTDANITDYRASFAAESACLNAGAACPQGVSDEVIDNATGRLTLQVSARNKLSLYNDHIHKVRASAVGAKDDQRVTGLAWDSPIYSVSTAKWTSTLSNRLLIQGGWSSNMERYSNLYQPGIHQTIYTPLWYQMASRVNTTDGTRFIAGPTELGEYPDRYNWQASAAYVTGSHNVQMGFQDSFGPRNQQFNANGDMYVNFATVNGVPNQPNTVTIMSTLPWFEDRLNAALGVYAQDSWVFKRVTANYGLRWNYNSQQVTGQVATQGTFAATPAYGNIQMPKQQNWDPHISIVADLFGTGKTAVRAGFNRYANTATTTLAATQDPGAQQSSSRPWTDVNGDGVAQYQVTHDAAGHLVSTCTYPSAGCEISFATLSSTYGFGLINNVQDPNLLRGYQDKINLGISHELMRGVSVSVEWFRTSNGNISSSSTYDLARLQPCGGITPGAGLSAADSHSLITCNEALNPASNPNYQAITVFSPIDGRPVTVYDVATTAVSTRATNNFIYTDTNPNRSLVYNGVDVGFNARLPHGGRMFGGTTTERTLNNSCNTAAQNPTLLQFCDDSNLGNGYSIPWKTQVKLAATYPLPWLGLVVNGSYQGLPGYAVAATTYSISSTTRNLTCPGNSVAAGCVVGALVAPTKVSTTLSAQLDPTGVAQTPRSNQVDLGISKRLQIGRVRINPKIDLFNALNSHDFYSVASVAFSPILDPNSADPTHSAALPANASGTNFPSYHQPARFLQGRIFRLGGDISW